MTNNYSLTTQKEWGETLFDLETTFERWGITEWETNYPRGARKTGSNQTIEERRVIVRYTKNGKELVLAMDKQARAVDNFRVLYLAIEAMRMNEKRGLGEVIESAYLQLAAPPKARDPYEVLEIREGASLAIAEAAYRAKMRTAHPDAGGSAEQVKELTDAIEEIRKCTE